MPPLVNKRRAATYERLTAVLTEYAGLILDEMSALRTTSLNQQAQPKVSLAGAETDWEGLTGVLDALRDHVQENSAPASEAGSEHGAHGFQYGTAMWDGERRAVAAECWGMPLRYFERNLTSNGLSAGLVVERRETLEAMLTAANAPAVQLQAVQRGELTVGAFRISLEQSRVDATAVTAAVRVLSEAVCSGDAKLALPDSRSARKAAIASKPAVDSRSASPAMGTPRTSGGVVSEMVERVLTESYQEARIATNVPSFVRDALEEEYIDANTTDGVRAAMGVAYENALFEPNPEDVDARRGSPQSHPAPSAILPDDDDDDDDDDGDGDGVSSRSPAVRAMRSAALHDAVASSLGGEAAYSFFDKGFPQEGIASLPVRTFEGALSTHGLQNTVVADSRAALTKAMGEPPNFEVLTVGELRRQLQELRSADTLCAEVHALTIALAAAMTAEGASSDAGTSARGSIRSSSSMAGSRSAVARHAAAAARTTDLRDSTLERVRRFGNMQP